MSMKVLMPVVSPSRRRSSCLTAPRVRTQLPFSTRDRSAWHSAHRLILNAVALRRRAVSRASSVCANSGRRLAETRTRRMAIGDSRLGSSSASFRATSSMMSSTSSKKSMLSLERRISSSIWLGEAGLGGEAGGSAATRAAPVDGPEVDVTGPGVRTGAGPGGRPAGTGGA